MGELKMATQIRKFEQDAIVETIVDRVISSKETQAKYAVKKCKEYKELLSTANEVKSFDKQINMLKEQRDELSTKVSRGVELYNYANDFELKYDRWNGVLSTQTGVNEWKLKEKIANKIAISLLPKDAVDNIDAIIENIVKECL